MKINFLKMHGCGNDFMIIDNRSGQLSLKQDQIRFLADRRKGVGFDQLITLELSQNAMVYMNIYNADGSTAKMCGNALRCVAGIIFEDIDQEEILIDTPSGITKASRINEENIAVSVGIAIFSSAIIPISKELDPLKIDLNMEGLPSGIAVSVGNPHIIFFLDQYNNFDLTKIGPIIENHAFFPDRINVSFAIVKDAHNIDLKTWERGAGITLACGSAASAAAAAAVKLGLTNNAKPINISMAGGTLIIEVSENFELKMIGPYTLVYQGVTEV
jgi:diaminopimelate epimerase